MFDILNLFDLDFFPVVASGRYNRMDASILLGIFFLITVTTGCSTAGHTDAPFGDMVLEFGACLFRASAISSIIATTACCRIFRMLNKIINTVKQTNGPGGECRSQACGIVRVVLRTMKKALETKLGLRDGQSSEQHHDQNL